MRDIWLDLQTNVFTATHAYLKHPDWKIHTVSPDGKTKLYSRITDKGLLGLKSVATMREHMADILYGATDFA